MIVGETASGKSALAMECARRYNGELICADSLTVYKGFDIGTAKPSQAERVDIPHHLLDVTTADKGFAAPEFKRQAEVAIEAICERGKLPIVVGGSGLYIDSLLYNYAFLEKSDPDLRSKLNAMNLPEVIALAQEKNLDLDGIDIRNKRRVIRHIENDGKVPARSPLRQDTIVVGLSVSRGTLEARIEQRVDAMLAAGLEKEAKMLANDYGWENEPMKSIGYREWKDYFDGADKIEKTRERIVAGTKRLAKKQRTWFGRNPDIRWVQGVEEVYGLVDSLRIPKSSSSQKTSKKHKP
ncbi:tRNA (adenosine(37)-N6)-dimethylallyltransferase MiaA [Candidatus Saccharibacteria bacterium]|nr:tRNA (adenosine(37)-N6)-dimethylallyltransferase MiaA [Candidatus Saccharibacteria bacterium]